MRANAATPCLTALAAAAACALISAPALAVVPVGYLDSATCDAIVGWSQDPDVPDAPIDVHIYLGGPAGSGNPAAVTSANIHRDDLCAAIGSCAHGYAVAPPLSLLDGAAHPIHAYGINNDAGGNPELGNSPRTLQCAPTASGVRRRVDGALAFDTWKFVSYWDLLPLPEAEGLALAMGPDVPDAPKLVQAAGAVEVWLVDGGARRLVSAAAATAWRFDLTKVEVVDAAEVEALAEGTPWRARPVLITAGGLHIVDDEQAAAMTGASSTTGAGSGGSGASSAEATGVGGSGNTGNDGGSGSGEGGSGTPADPAGGDGGGCGIGASGGGPSGVALATVAAACLLARARRRRTAR